MCLKTFGNIQTMTELFLCGSIVFMLTLRRVTRVTSAVLFIMCFVVSVPAAPVGNSATSYNGGMSAYNRGDFSTALKKFRPLADSGLDAAQNNLGVLYENGQGVPRDYAEAAKWYRLAADRGLATAQFNLGLLYAKGQGVPQDYVLAHMWFNLSAAQGNKDAKRDRDKAAQFMTIAQIAKAQQLAREWRPIVQKRQ
jgi:uncharacterized protein